MSEKQLQKEIQADLQQAGGQVIYLEGKTDPALFFSLLGVAEPLDGIHDQVLVKGLGARGSGNFAVQRRVQLARDSGYGGVFGVIDGDGQDLSTLKAQFDEPYSGPCFSWRAYSIENLVVKAGWPPAWGDEPEWEGVLLELVPYAALNSVALELRDAMAQLGVAKFINPNYQAALKTAEVIGAALDQSKHLIEERDIVGMFNDTVVQLQNEVVGSLDAGHARINGKWLLEGYLSRKTGHTLTRCIKDIAAHVTSIGGLPEVRSLWQRITKRAP